MFSFSSSLPGIALFRAEEAAGCLLAVIVFSGSQIAVDEEWGFSVCVNTDVRCRTGWHEASIPVLAGNPVLHNK